MRIDMVHAPPLAVQNLVYWGFGREYHGAKGSSPEGRHAGPIRLIAPHPPSNYNREEPAPVEGLSHFTYSIRCGNVRSGAVCLTKEVVYLGQVLIGNPLLNSPFETLDGIVPRNPDKHHRHSIRLKDYDYSQAGAYFVTICTRDREGLFGEIAEGLMRLSPFGEIIRACWDNLPRHYPHVALDAFVIMPNHIHGIIVLADPAVVGVGFKPTPTLAVS